MKRIALTYILLLLSGCGFNEVRPESVATFQNSAGDTISINRDRAIVRGKSYPGHDCSTGTMQCIDYSGYFSIISPRSCKDLDQYPWKVGTLLATNLGVDHHRSRTMYGVNLGEMIAYDYSWTGDGVVGLAFDSTHKIANSNALENIGYRDPSIFYEKVSGPAFMTCRP